MSLNTGPLPAPPAIRVMAALAAANRNVTHRPSADDLIEHHLARCERQGITFDPWTAEGAERFRLRRTVRS